MNGLLGFLLQKCIERFVGKDSIDVIIAKRNIRFFLKSARKIAITSFLTIVVLTSLLLFFDVFELKTKSQKFFSSYILNNFDGIRGFFSLEEYSNLKLTVTGTNFSPKERVESITLSHIKSYKDFAGNNLQSIKEDIMQDEIIENVTIIRLFPNRLRILIKEKIPMFRYAESSDIFTPNVITSKGDVIKVTPGVWLKNLPVANCQMQYLKKPQLENLIQIISLYPDINRHLSSIKCFFGLRWIIKLDDNTTILLPKDNYDEAVYRYYANQESILKRVNSLGLGKISKIDLRFDGKIFLAF